MRIILLAAAAIGAVTIGTAALARPVGGGSGRGGSLQVGWSNGGGHHARMGGSTHFGPGAGKGDGRRHGRFGRSGRQGVDPYGGGGTYGGIGLAGPIGPYGNGYFTGRGGQSRVRGGQAYYDYDRSYPYEWGSAVGGGRQRVVEDVPIEPSERCTMENGVRVCRGW